MTRACFAVFLLLVSGCGLRGVAPYYALDAAPPTAADRASEADAMVLDDACRLRHAINAEDVETRIDCHRATLIVREEGLVNAEVQLSPGEGTLYNLSGRTILANGTIVPFDPSTARELIVARTAGPSGREAKALVFAFAGAKPGSIVEYRYTIVVPRLLFTYRRPLDDSLPVRRARFELDTLEEAVVRSRTRGFTGPVIGAPSSGRQVYVWELQDHAPFTDEPLRIDPARTTPEVEFAVEALRGSPNVGPEVPLYRGWSETLEPAWRSANSACGAIDAAPARTFSVADRPEVERAWREVQRAVDDRGALSVAESGFRTPEEIVSSGFGNADDRTLVLFCRLKRLGFDPGLVFLPWASSPDPSAELFSLTGVEDWAVYLRATDGPPLVLDPACVGCTAGELSAAHQTRRGIVLAATADGFDANPFVKSATIAAPAYRYRHRVHFSAQGLVLDRGDVRLSGWAAARVRREIDDEATGDDDRARILRRRFLERHHGGTISAEGLQDADGPLEVTVLGTLWSRVGMTRAGDYLFESIADVLPLGGAEWLEAQRVAPVDFVDPPDFEHSLTVAIPAGHEVVKLPAPRKVACKGGEYVLSAKTSSVAIELEERIRIAPGVVGLDAYPELHAFLEQVRAARQQRFVLKKVR